MSRFQDNSMSWFRKEPPVMYMYQRTSSSFLTPGKVCLPGEVYDDEISHIQSEPVGKTFNLYSNIEIY